ncbi:hypothetical protein Ava_D0006 [Trichormus variabilis ATCC 29413]|uniref:Uncharacterized protein n=2 Tax=Anabaena variabilis TaxID=264691 RepID=Q3M2W5_TRIV2|nr:hypothetical protein [Trichormus variabilis]ABA24671.1 hypothetical protein Ava_D0006 [Trichormus variabilis ATCC 29413]MBC1217706.1 hypothetical protein [Trichormus variabilis ARAD]MBC1259003.1 hypothetical protein [Trichormus variabilis V5]MBC1302714.1 hypothetical protein [Trichormus variabilis N2B]MBC1324569.1 hypothetical protein [Trichormus variabilis 9RC]
MPALSELDKSRCRFHLGYGAGVPAGDRARLEEAMNLLQDDYEVQRIQQILERCDRAFEASELLGDSSRFNTKELYTGDINRAILRESARDSRVWWENYLKETDLLAAHPLWVPNYRQEANLRYRFARTGAEFIMAVPGVADTCTGDRISMSTNYG